MNEPTKYTSSTTASSKPLQLHSASLRNYNFLSTLISKCTYLSIVSILYWDNEFQNYNILTQMKIKYFNIRYICQSKANS